jgi:hypothetical protein
MGSVGILPRVVIVQFLNQSQELGNVELALAGFPARTATTISSLMYLAVGGGNVAAWTDIVVLPGGSVVNSSVTGTPAPTTAPNP